MRLAALLVLLAPAAASASGLSLEQAVRLAATRNERAGIAREARVASGARIVEARSLFLPQLTLVGTYTRRAHESVRQVGGETVTVQSLNALGTSTTATLTLFDARSFPLYRAALREDEATAAGSADDVRRLGFEAAAAYVTALGSAQVVQAAEQRLDLAGRVLEVARARFAAQIVRSNDVSKAELEQATAEQALTQARGALTDAELQLGFLVGAAVEGPLDEPQGLLAAASAPPPAAAQLLGAAQARRLDVLAGRRHGESLRETAKEPLMRYIPSLAVSGQVRTTNEAGLTGRNLDWSIAAVLTWRIFDGGLALGERSERLALAASSELETAALVRRVELELRQALVGLENGQASLKQTAVALEAAQKNARETAQLYRQGLAPALDVASANSSLFDAEVAAIQARYTVALAYLDLRAAQGLDALGQEVRP